ncbi:MAG: ABC transporter permease [Spirochaetales bacterium]|nr:ABC transporter permease [Spirochaetales bacterium]
MKKRELLTRTVSVLGKIEGLPVICVYILLTLIFIAAAPAVFTNYPIYMSFLQTITPQLVLALGLTLVITAGEIDLSFPAIVAFSGFIFAFVFKTTGLSWLAFPLALAGGALVGFINGIFITRVGVPSIMATLATQFVFNGITLLLSSGLILNIKEIRGTAIHEMFVGRLFGIIPVQAFWAVGLAVLLWFILNRHKFGEAIMFIGDNADVARVMGINVENTKVLLFTVNGIIAAFASVLLTLEMVTFWTTQGSGFLLTVMAAVFIGGTSISGGEGVIVGTFFGAFIIGSLEASVVATGIGDFWVRLTEGLVMGGSIALNALIKGNGKGFSKVLKASVFVKNLKK